MFKILFLLLFILFQLANVQCNHESLPEVEMLPTSSTPKICVSADRSLPPCGIGKFKEHQRKYERQIRKIMESYVDMIIDYKDGKNSSFENFGQGKIYLKSFDSLTSELEEEERQKLLKKSNLSNIEDELLFGIPENFEIQREEEPIDDLNFRTSDDEPSIIQITRAARSLEMTVLVADECIPLGVLFCDFADSADDINANIEVTKQKRSIPSITDFVRRFSPHQTVDDDDDDVKNDDGKPEIMDF